MVEFRPVNLESDRDFLLSMFLLMLFEAEPEGSRRKGMPAFAAQIGGTSVQELQMRGLQASLQDPRTIAEIVQVDSSRAGFVWATFTELPGYFTVAVQLRALAFSLNFQRRGLGRLTVQHVEELAAERGAVALRSIGSAPSEAVRRFHASLGFEPVQTVFEKKLTRRP